MGVTDCLVLSAPFGGIEVHFRLLARALAASDRIGRLDAIWLEHEPPERLSRRVPLRLSWYTAAAWATRRRLDALREAGSRPDVALANHVNPALFLDRTVRLPPLVVHLDTTPLVTASMGEQYLGRSERPAAVERAKLAVYRRTFAVPRRIAVSSRLAARSLVEDYEVDEAVVSLVPYSVDLERWTRRDPSAPRPDPPQVLFVGADFVRKGGDVLLAAARRPELAGCEIHVVTRTDVPDPPPNVVVHGALPAGSDALVERFAAASAFVLPTAADLSPVVLLEAMAMEVPVVSTRVGAIDELVDDDVNGYLVAPGDVDALTERLVALIDDPGRRDRLGRAGRERIVAEHSLARNVHRFLDLLEAT